mmetsp:Transcript_12312/g.15605  ORF Transcript_12312/g.15605 Transcript_12312/m.15605 type:complete len:558 (+) Transcript_12312:66-1739(+)|eukprot:CAMPEP_0117754100 /NCGR_PEP_ID=MMETSP0947-20121206/12630_1 /TAXON_ID=44440 /ORGANISM="Chattonella subsalsa, Strain CCMP2191" /LENGTH=557 /DNA_ID=CAMNT_0005573129 /DNA_START=33 /DNA_END=1706 /DNA_ORIENTATION=+
MAEFEASNSEGWGKGEETDAGGGWGQSAEASAVETPVPDAGAEAENWGSSSAPENGEASSSWGASAAPEVNATSDPSSWGVAGDGAAEDSWGAAGVETNDNVQAEGETYESGGYGGEFEEQKVKKQIEHAADVVKMLAIEDEETKKNRIRVIQSDPDHHLSSAKNFSELNLPDHLLSGVYGMGFDRPSQIQEVALPLILESPPKNLIGQAQSGSGKTVAFTLGMLFRVDVTKHYPQAICVAPTRELANQILSDVIVKMAANMQGLKCQLALAGIMIPRGEQCSAHVVVGTPGKIEDWIRRGLLDPSGVKVFVLDEADEMICEDGHREQSISIHRKMSPQCQTLFFSATFNEEVFDFAKRIVRNPNIIKLASDEELVLDVIKQLWIDTRGNKPEVMGDIYDLLTMGQSIVFVATKIWADTITRMLVEKGFDVATLHGDLDNMERDLLMDEFRQGKRKVLITTNVLARGVDVPAVSLVVNYDIPRTYEGRPDFENYLHRIGRTGRFGRKGVAINFVDSEEDKRLLEEIANHFSPTRTMIFEAPPDDVEELEKIIQGAQS